ncbi:CbtA family protein [Rhizobium sp. Root1204]|uniref:CbtA family protein n=1 Tax=Rhizobium sp. Root1204 TaxID=1736428 RepID=UPI000712E3BF|nr:CbtA family protein [Rhizobium sp. Root1204]KQV41334.1 hypothetical protein ASC96_18765 [Rhizobium sp. Root1204]
MVGSLLLRGMIVGFVAGLLVFAVAFVFGEPLVETAVSFEKQVAHATGEPHEHLVGRATQSGLGLATATVVFGTALGGLFALVYAFAQGRVSSFGPRATAALIALAAFVAIALVPDLKYPANPPAVGAEDTIGARTVLFFVMILISVITLCASISLLKALRPRFGVWDASIITAVSYISIIGLAQYLLPSVNEVPENFPAVTLWSFRATSLGMHAVLWGVLGLGFGAWMERGNRAASVDYARRPSHSR